MNKSLDIAQYLVDKKFWRAGVSYEILSYLVDYDSPYIQYVVLCQTGVKKTVSFAYIWLAMNHVNNSKLRRKFSLEFPEFFI